MSADNSMFDGRPVTHVTPLPEGSEIILTWEQAVQVQAALTFYSRMVSMLDDTDLGDQALAKLRADAGGRAGGSPLTFSCVHGRGVRSAC